MFSKSVSSATAAMAHRAAPRVAVVQFRTGGRVVSLGASAHRALSTAAAQSEQRSESSFWKVAAVGLGATAAALLTATEVEASEDNLQPQHLPWSHHGNFSAYDTASLRRGYEVYRQVCSQCHTLKFVKFRHLVGVTHTEDQAKALAASYTLKDGPNDKGEMFERPGKLSDGHPEPYPNPEFARYANGGALPPDLSCMVKARMRHEDYVYSLLNGYCEPPAGVEIREGLHYNPYFPGGAIAMGKPLSDGMLENEDGTPATVSQMAKDVATFLSWASEPETDERKLMGVKVLGALSVTLAFAVFNKRRVWSVIKTRKTTYRPISGPYNIYNDPKAKKMQK